MNRNESGRFAFVIHTKLLSFKNISGVCVCVFFFFWGGGPQNNEAL